VSESAASPPLLFALPGLTPGAASSGLPAGRGLIGAGSALPGFGTLLSTRLAPDGRAAEAISTMAISAAPGGGWSLLGGGDSSPLNPEPLRRLVEWLREIDVRAGTKGGQTPQPDVQALLATLESVPEASTYGLDAAGQASASPRELADRIERWLAATFGGRQGAAPGPAVGSGANVVLSDSSAHATRGEAGGSSHDTDAEAVRVRSLSPREIAPGGEFRFESLRGPARSGRDAALQLANVVAGRPSASSPAVTVRGEADSVVSTLSMARSGAPDGVDGLSQLRSADPGVLRPSFQALAEQAYQRVVWMSREGISRARVHLSPPELGRIDIRLEIEGNDARLQLGTQNASVRDALEGMLPRLRDAMSQQGLNLSEADVSDHGTDSQGGEERPGNAGRHAAGPAGNAADGEPSDGEAVERSASSEPAVGLIDAYA
jgi:flagellar hook-length control protein FliK